MATAEIQNKELVRVNCLHELFEAQVDRDPDRTALVCRNNTYSYGELEQLTNRLARRLRELGVGAGKLVGLYFDRTEKPIIAILAILKAGGGYVPIDPVFPGERARHILDEADAVALLTDQDLAPRVSEFYDGVVEVIDPETDLLVEYSDERLSLQETGVSPSDLCYVLYTSGTTGRPKGVMAEHRNVVHFTRAFNEIHGIGPSDRVFQGFSLGFDGSVEEIWMAFSNGATLVIGTSDVVKFGEEVARLFAEEEVTVFSTVPTFLSMIDADLPSLRIVIVSGEPCPPDLVNRWARPGRRMLNVYGPTETTVNAASADCLPGQPVTIGRPLRGYEIHLLDENLQPVPSGEAGELYIGGPGLARGYMNQPELTAKQFIPSPFASSHTSPRLYKTGDLVSYDANGELIFHRRIDRQVKIRGYRIELSEIESVLREFPLVHQAVVNVYEREGLKELAAYVVPKVTADPFDRDSLLQLLRDRLPPYMVPSYLDLIDQMPTLASGKADRSRLPAPETPLVASNRTIVEPATEWERQLCEVWKQVFHTETISCTDDFFTDLGGYSLLAAEVASLLRARHGCELPIREVYRHPTIQSLASFLEQQASDRETSPTPEQQPRPSSRENFHRVSPLTRGICYTLQGISIAISYGLISLPLLILAYLILGVIDGTVSMAILLSFIIATVFLSTPLAIATSIVVKWLVIGRYKPGEYPVWSFYYFRWWLASRVQSLSDVERYAGTPIMSLYYRLMGAKVGKYCTIDTSGCSIFDLVTIGDETSIGTQTQLLGYRVEDGLLKIGTTTIGSRCFIGTHSALGLNTTMEDDSYLDDMSLLPDGGRIVSGEGRRGSPAQPAEVPLPEISDEAATQRHPFWMGWAHFLASEVVGELMLLTAVPSILLIVGTYLVTHSIPWTITSALASIPIGVVSYCIITAGVKLLILRKSLTGTFPLESWYYLRKWASDIHFSTSSRVLSMIYTTIYLPAWLRLMGAKIGRRAEISTVTILTPDLIDIGEESFFADGSMVGGRRIFRGHVQFARNTIGRRSFVGNNAHLPLGASMGKGCLLGVVSSPPGGVGSHIPDGTEWLGSPPFQLPYRQKVEGFDARETFAPTARLYALRCFIDAMRIFLPIFIALAGIIVYFAYLVVGLIYFPFWGVLLLSPVASSLIAFGMLLSVVAIKKLLMGTFVPEIKPLWSVYVWLNELVNGLFEGLAAPIMVPMKGTPFYCWYLRLMGCKIGKHVFMETSLFSEFDLVEIGDYAALNLGVVVQNHLFEDRIMKSSYLKIGDECSVGNMSVVLYDSVMHRGASIGPMSLLMKGESLPEGTHWLGIPTEQIH